MQLKCFWPINIDNGYDISEKLSKICKSNNENKIPEIILIFEQILNDLKKVSQLSLGVVENRATIDLYFDKLGLFFKLTFMHLKTIIVETKYALNMLFKIADILDTLCSLQFSCYTSSTTFKNSYFVFYQIYLWAISYILIKHMCPHDIFVEDKKYYNYSMHCFMKLLENSSVVDKDELYSILNTIPIIDYKFMLTFKMKQRL